LETAPVLAGFVGRSGSAGSAASSGVSAAAGISVAGIRMPPPQPAPALDRHAPTPPTPTLQLPPAPRPSARITQPPAAQHSAVGRGPYLHSAPSYHDGAHHRLPGTTPMAAPHNVPQQSVDVQQADPVYRPTTQPALPAASLGSGLPAGYPNPHLIPGSLGLLPRQGQANAMAALPTHGVTLTEAAAVMLPAAAAGPSGGAGMGYSGPHTELPVPEAGLAGLLSEPGVAALFSDPAIAALFSDPAVLHQALRLLNAASAAQQQQGQGQVVSGAQTPSTSEAPPAPFHEASSTHLQAVTDPSAQRESTPGLLRFGVPWLGRHVAGAAPAPSTSGPPEGVPFVSDEVAAQPPSLQLPQQQHMTSGEGGHVFWPPPPW
jgi:hypothetical protein